MLLSLHSQKKQAFTIVEIIVVVMVIAILAAISVVSYSAVTNNAKTSTLKGDLMTVSAALKKHKADSGSFPLVQSDVPDIMKASDGVSLRYVYDRVENEYCLLGSADGADRFYINSGITEPKQGDCPESSLTPTYTGLTGGYSNGQVNITVNGDPHLYSLGDTSAYDLYYCYGSSTCNSLLTIRGQIESGVNSAWVDFEPTGTRSYAPPVTGQVVRYQLIDYHDNNTSSPTKCCRTSNIVDIVIP